MSGSLPFYFSIDLELLAVGVPVPLVLLYALLKQHGGTKGACYVTHETLTQELFESWFEGCDDLTGMALAGLDSLRLVECIPTHGNDDMLTVLEPDYAWIAEEMARRKAAK